MFNRKKQPPIRTLIGEGTVIAGEIQFTEGMRIDGQVNGDVTAVGDDSSILVISENARVTGKVKAGHVIISGQVMGPVHSVELLELQPKARVVGNISYGVLEMHQGASIDGEVHPIKAEAAPVLKLAAAAGDA
ncbi:MAG: polymer-forming cytoskeletal protein [Burkholderiales bacterium]